MEYRNPIPVIVGIVFVSRREVLLVKRAIEPCIGGWALPSGYIEEGDDWRERLRIELEEEACVVVSTDPKYMQMYEGCTTPDGKRLLLFAVVKQDGIIERREFVPNHEVSEIRLGTLDYYARPGNICFPLHEKVLDQHARQFWDFDSQHPGGW